MTLFYISIKLIVLSETGWLAYEKYWTQTTIVSNETLQYFFLSLDQVILI